MATFLIVIAYWFPVFKRVKRYKQTWFSSNLYQKHIYLIRKDGSNSILQIILVGSGIIASECIQNHLFKLGSTNLRDL